MVSRQELIDFLNSDLFDPKNKWAIHLAIKDVVSAVDNGDLTYDAMIEVLNQLFVRLGWKTSSQIESEEK